ncbi:MAG: hypothetical protein ACFCUO_12575 [Rhodospirillales bacterium]
MAQHTLVLANERLFARKGEAAPAGGAVTGFAASALARLPRNDPNATDAQPRKRNQRGPSPLSGLIQRGVRVPESPGDGGAPRITEHAVFASWRQLRGRLETAGPSNADPAWRKLTFRLRGDQHARLKNLAVLWNTTFQSILEKAVTYYIDEATTSEDFK